MRIFLPALIIIPPFLFLEWRILDYIMGKAYKKFAENEIKEGRGWLL